MLLFKPCSCFADLFNGICWEDSYDSTDFSGYTIYVENIHIGLKEKNDSRNKIMMKQLMRDQMN